MATTSAWRLTLVEMVTMRPMPAACARATTASSSPAKSGKSRWQWLSISMRYTRDCGWRGGRPGVLASMPHIGRRRVGVLLLEVGDLARQILEQALALRRRVVDRQLRDRLAERGDDLVHVENVLVAAGRAVFRVELVDHVGDQAVQTWPLVVRSGFIVSHGPSSALCASFAVDITGEHRAWCRQIRAGGNPVPAAERREIALLVRNGKQIEPSRRRMRHERDAQDRDLPDHLGGDVEHGPLPHRIG